MRNLRAGSKRGPQGRMTLCKMKRMHARPLVSRLTGSRRQGIANVDKSIPRQSRDDTTRLSQASKPQEARFGASSRPRKPYRAKCQTETRAISGGCVAFNFMPLTAISPCNQRKSSHNTHGIKLLKINALFCDGGAVRLIRTRLCKDSDAVPYAAQRPRHSARAAVRFCLKWSRLERLRSWLK